LPHPKALVIFLLRARRLIKDFTDVVPPVDNISRKYLKYV
jgi:hypothetical protein